LFEFSSSGLSHTQSDSLPWAKKNMQLVGPEFYQETEPEIKINYGVIELLFEDN
jgi:hypothetical protein